MPELRWILLGGGVALILGLWWWETRKTREGSAAEPGVPRPRQRAEPTLAGGLGDDLDDFEPGPAQFVPTIERARVPRRPPLVEIPDDVEVDISDYVGHDRRHAAGPEFEAPAEAAAAESVTAKANDNGDQPAEDEHDEHHRAPWIRTQPLERSEVAPQPQEEPAEPVPTDPIERQTAEASKQRIVALRLVAPDGGWPGHELRLALEAEGLRFGRYSIFHREREDGKTLIYAASMMEPGSFDLATMDNQVIPGISLFGIVPGPIDAPSTFDLVLTVGRHVAERIKGQLQDEQGSTLTAQRILNLREELVHFEHRNRRLRRS